MTIRTDTIEALNQQQEQARAKRQSSAGGFGELLSQEVEKSESQADAVGSAPPPGALSLGALLAAEATPAAETISDAEQNAMDNIDSILGKWENYADRLKSSQPEEGLRQAYGVLESISSDVQDLKETMPVLGADSPLNSLVNELEILTVTEQIKFNRGDYMG